LFWRQGRVHRQGPAGWAHGWSVRPGSGWTKELGKERGLTRWRICGCPAG
jgi:hypothetical protein